MKSITTKRGKRVELRTLSEWYDIIEHNHPDGNHLLLVALEQAEFQSEKYKVCVECLGTEKLVHKTDRLLIASTDYYMCEDCIDYYEIKNGCPPIYGKPNQGVEN